MKVCEKVQKKGLTSYNEVADELVGEFSDPRNMSPSDQVSHVSTNSFLLYTNTLSTIIFFLILTEFQKKILLFVVILVDCVSYDGDDFNFGRLYLEFFTTNQVCV